MEEKIIQTLADETEEPSYVNDPSQVGNKIWRLIPGDGIKIRKETSSSVDTYTFEGNVSPDEGNIVEVRENGLYIPEVTSKSEELKNELEELKEKVENLKSMEFRSTESVMMKKDTDLITGEEYVIADVNISLSEGNNLILKADGLYSKATDYGPGSITDIERRLKLLEEELMIINQEIDNLKTTAFIDRSGSVTPPVVVPGHSAFPIEGEEGG